MEKHTKETFKEKLHATRLYPARIVDYLDYGFVRVFWKLQNWEEVDWVLNNAQIANYRIEHWWRFISKLWELLIISDVSSCSIIYSGFKQYTNEYIYKFAKKEDFKTIQYYFDECSILDKL